MNRFNEETHIDLMCSEINVITENKIHVLPVLIQNHAVVEIFLTEKKTVVIESQHHPIRHGKICGSKIHFGAHYGTIDYNPKLIWNGKEWLVQTFGTFLFPEIEINVKERE